MSSPFPFVRPPVPVERPVGPAPLIIPTVFESDDDPLRSLADRRIIFLNGRIDDAAANEAIARLIALDRAGNDPITLLINSGGGPLASIVAVLDTLGGCASLV